MSNSAKKVIYTDSKTAIAWVRNKQPNSSFDYSNCSELKKDMDECIGFIKNRDLSCFKITKWDTVNWGQIPSDFGRK